MGRNLSSGFSKKSDVAFVGSRRGCTTIGHGPSCRAVLDEPRLQALSVPGGKAPTMSKWYCSPRSRGQEWTLFHAMFLVRFASHVSATSSPSGPGQIRRKPLLDHCSRIMRSRVQHHIVTAIGEDETGRTVKLRYPLRIMNDGMVMITCHDEDGASYGGAINMHRAEGVLVYYGRRFRHQSSVHGLEVLVFDVVKPEMSGGFRVR